MSKNLRVFLLSVLVVILGVSSAFAAALTKYTLTPNTVIATDTTGDGNVDTGFVDLDNDGNPDAANVDTDGDGNLDALAATVALDTDGNIVYADDAHTRLAGYFDDNGILRIDLSGLYTFADGYSTTISDATALAFGTPWIDSILLDETGLGYVSNATFVVPTPSPTDAPAQGTGGAWVVNWPTQVRNSSGVLVGVDKNNRVKFRLEKRSTNSAIIVDDGVHNVLADINVLADAGPNFAAGCDLEINVPFRVNNALSAATPLQATLNVLDDTTVMFDREAEIFSEGTEARKNYPSGYSDNAAASIYNVAAAGKLIIRNTWALRGDNLTVNVLGTLTFDLPSGTIHDLRDRWDAYNGDDVVLATGAVPPGTTLNVDGTIEVLSDMTLYGKILVPDADGDGNLYVTKSGPGKLTLSNSSAFYNILPLVGNIYTGSLPTNLDAINVNAGTLELASEPSWQSAGTNTGFAPAVNVSSGAFFIANTESMRQTIANMPFVFNVSGTATFKDHAIVMGENEIYPYGDFITLNNGIVINARRTVLNVASTGKVVVDNGGLAAGKIAGTGTIEINNTATNEDASKDIAVLILTRPLGVVEVTDANGNITAVNNVALITDDNYARSYIDFEGTITGTHANVGLYVSSSAELPYSRRIFQKASVDIENLIIYGPAQLNVNANTNLDGVGNVWLRGHRPGAENFNEDGSVNAPVAYAKLTVGKLNFIPSARNSEINLNGLKVDGSSSYEDMGALNVLVIDNDSKDATTALAPRDYSLVANRETAAIGPRLTANISNLQLYANKGTNKDFPVNYANPAKGIYALRINGTEQPSRVVIDGTTVTGDGVAADVTDKVHQIEIMTKSDVRFTGKGGAEYYPAANNNSIMVRHDAKLEIDRGAVVGGNLTFEPSSSTFAAVGLGTGADSTLGTETHETNNDVIHSPNGIFRFASHWVEAYCTVHADTETMLLNEYPADEDFISDEGWYDGARSFTNGYAFTNNGRANGPTINSTLDYDLRTFLNNFTAFTTQVGDRNRWDNEAGEYAVRVKGDLTFAEDEFEGYAGRGQVLVRVKPDLTAYDSHEFTTIAKRFKVIGSEVGEGGDYYSDFATSYNRFFLFRIPSSNADTRGVTVENRDELAIVTLGDWYFMRGGDDFGLGNGHDFTIRVPFKIMYRDEEVTIAREVDANNDVRYVLGLGTDKYQIAGCPVFFGYDEGMASSVENVSDITALTTLATITNNENRKYVSDDITMNAEFEVVGDEQFIRLIGTSYSGEKPVKVRLALYLINVTSGKATWLDGVVPAFRELTLIRNGVTPPETGTQYSSAKAVAVGKTNFTVSEDATVSFRVPGIRRATYETNSVPEFVNGKYEWKVKAETGTYYMLDSQGREARVTDLVVVRYDGDYLKRTTQETVINEGFTITIDAEGALVSMPASLLGTTGTNFNADKGLALKGRRIDSDGEIISVPVMYKLHSEVKPEDTVAVPQLSKVVTKGETVEGVFDVPPTDLSGNINDIKLIAYGDEGLPDWLGFYGNGGTISYKTGDLSGVKSGVYTFRVLAYTGENATTSPHKLYTFTVTVLDPVQPHIAPETDVTINAIIGGEAQTTTLTFISGDESVVTWSIADNTNPAGLLTGAANGNTYVLTAKAAADVVAGSYAYVVNANGGEFSRKVTVVVSEPNFAIETVSNGFEDNSPMDAHVYTAIFRISGAQGEEVVWNFTDNTRSELYTYHSGDMFVVEGVAKLAQDADDNAVDQTFRVVATAGNRTVEEPVETTFTVDADETTYTALAPKSGSHDAVDAAYAVDFPANVTAAEDAVFLPSWLEPVLNADGDVVGIKFSKTAGELANGTKATVRIEATDNSEELADDDDGSRYYGWDVTYNAKPADLALVLTPSPLTVAGGQTSTVTATVTSAQDAVEFSLAEGAPEWVTIDKTTGTLTVTAPATAGTYNVTVIARDSRGTLGQATADLTITVTGDVPPSPFSISVDPSTLTFTSPTASAQTVTLSSNFLGGTVTYTAAVTTGSETGLYLEVSESTLTVDPLAAGSYVVTVTGTNGTNTATATVNVTVSNGSTPSSFSISASPSTLTFTSPSAADQTVELSANIVGATVTYTAAVTTGSEAGLDLEVSGSTLTVDPVAAGTYVITVTGTNGTDTATTRVSVTVGNTGRVGSSGGGCDAGFGALALVLAAPLFLRRRRS